MLPPVRRNKSRRPAPTKDLLGREPERCCARPRRAALCCAIAILVLAGCSPRWYRMDADRETYGILSAKLADVRWYTPRVNISPELYSRFGDPYDTDRPPMPPDDPVAHVDMHYPAGIRGYRHWHD